MKIKELLEEFRTNRKVIKQLYENYSIREIMEVVLSEKMYDILLELFEPIEVDNEEKIYFDFFSYIDFQGNLERFLDKLDLSEEEKEELKKRIFDIDLERIKKLKVKNTQARRISGWNNSIRDINDVIFLSEPALLETMIYLYNNNIRTISNDTKCVDNEKENGKSNIIINYDELSEENREYADSLVEMGFAYIKKSIDGEYKELIIEVETNANDTIGEISNRFIQLAKGFKYQKDTYNRVSIEEVKNDLIRIICIYYEALEGIEPYIFEIIDKGLVSEDENGDIKIDDKIYLKQSIAEELIKNDDFLEKFIGELKPFYYYDKKEKVIWRSKEAYDKYIREKMMQEDSNENRNQSTSSKKRTGE